MNNIGQQGVKGGREEEGGAEGPKELGSGIKDQAAVRIKDEGSRIRGQGSELCFCYPFYIRVLSIILFHFSKCKKHTCNVFA